MLCLVTDRARVGGAAALADLARAAAAAGVDIIQVRERDLDAAALSALVDELLRATRGSATRVVVNDRLDVALACGADGVHLRGDSIAIADARCLAPRRFLIGRSVHSAAAAAAAAGADYVIAGTVFPSSSKPERGTWLGVDGLRAIVRASAAPVLAIGGITLDRFADAAAAGARGAAAISLFVDAPLADVVARARRVFDDVARPAVR